jgi:adenylate kinase
VKDRLLLLGPPASGKGSQADFIQRRFGIPTTSTGAILRAEAKSGRPLGLKAQEIIRAGGLAPDDVIMEVVQAWLTRIDGSFLLDGFPRTVAQAERFDHLLKARGQLLDLAIFLELPEQTIYSRMALRLTCTRCGKAVSLGRHVKDSSEPCPNCGGRLEIRADDNQAALARRMEEYRNKTLPVTDFYERTGILARVNGDREIEAVSRDIERLIEG